MVLTHWLDGGITVLNLLPAISQSILGSASWETWQIHQGRWDLSKNAIKRVIEDKMWRVQINWWHLAELSVFLIRFCFHLEPPTTQSRFCSNFSSLSNVLFTRKPWRGRPSEPWPTTALHLTPTPYKHIRRCLQPSMFIGELGEILGAIVSSVSSYQTIAFSTVH
jgi:hypothetical protein